jgi:hypothetical protein
MFSKVKLALVVPAAVLVCGLCVGIAGASPTRFVTSVRFGGKSGKVNTPAKVVALLRASKGDSITQLRTLLNGLTPRDRAYVIKEGFTPARAVESSHGKETPAPTGAHAACVHPNYNWTKSFQFRLYNPVGWTIYEYQSNWQWGGGCDNVVYAHHQETSTYTMPGWVYNGSSYGAGYGAVGTHMVGRETYGHFSYVIDGVVDNTVDQQVQVNGDPGWWTWARATGFGT